MPSVGETSASSTKHAMSKTDEDVCSILLKALFEKSLTKTSTSIPYTYTELLNIVKETDTYTELLNIVKEKLKKAAKKAPERASEDVADEAAKKAANKEAAREVAKEVERYLHLLATQDWAEPVAKQDRAEPVAKQDWAEPVAKQDRAEPAVARRKRYAAWQFKVQPHCDQFTATAKSILKMDGQTSQ
jgi:hypothetical protein